MSSGRGRGYTGRHQRERPGDTDHSEDQDAARTLAELSPRSPDPARLELLNKTEPPRETNPPKPEMRQREPDAEGVKEKEIYSSADDDAALQELLKVDEQYTPLLTLLEQFSPGEDGIQFNRKLRQFETTITSMCPDEARLQQAFATLRAAALLSAVTSRKLAAVGASFTRQQRQQLLRLTLLNIVMQGTFSKLEVLERSNPLCLINAANLMGDYFAEARLCNGNKVLILASPLVQYMKALLASDDIRAHRSLATQLMQNGRELLSLHAQEMDDLSISIRLRLLTPPPVSTVWLLLSADLCLNKFLPLPNTLQQFYASHLDLNTDENYSEVSYGSWKKSPEKEEFRPDVSDASSEKVLNISSLSLNEDLDTMKPKLRPILGAGAALMKQDKPDVFDTWAPKNSLSKRYDLNSWRQADDEQEAELVFNPSVLPPTNVPPPNLGSVAQNLGTSTQNLSIIPSTNTTNSIPGIPANIQSQPPPNVTNFVPVPDYPPPNVRFPENFPNYLQQGDGAYIQSQYTPNQNTNYNSGDGFQTSIQNVRTQPIIPEKVNNEVQKTANSSKKPVENWRREKSEINEDPNKNRQKNWLRQRSKDSVNEEDEKEKFKRNSREIKPGGRSNRRSSAEEPPSKSPPRRHVSEVPRSNKYWDHDDRCDKDYNS